MNAEHWYDRCKQSVAQVMLMLASYLARVLSPGLPDRLALLHGTVDPDKNFKSLADCAPTILWVTDESHACTFLSRGWAQFTGQSVEEGLGFGWTQAVHPEDRHQVTRGFLGAATRCEQFQLEHRILHHSGEYHWVIDSGRPRYSETREFLGFVGSVIDVHERRLIEETLRQSEARERAKADELATILDAVPAAVFIANDPACTRIRANSSGYRMLGFGNGRSELAPPIVNGSSNETTHHERRRSVILPENFPLQRAAQGEVVRDYELDLDVEEGHKCHFIGNAVPLFDETGTPRGAVGAFTDITASKRAEAALQESEARFREMADGVPLIVWVHDASGDQVLVNNTFCEFFGVTREDMRGGRWQMFVHPDDADEYTGKFLACLRERRDFQAEVRVKRADGQWRWLESWGKPRFDSAGEFRGFVGTSADVTARKNAEAALREANKSKDAFLAMLGHELRNPLAPLSNGVELLRDVGDKPELLENVRNMMQRQLSHLVRLVDDLLDVSRISRGRIELHKSAVDLHNVVNVAVEMTEPAIRDRNHHLVVQHSKESLPVDGDFSRLVQVVGNLLSNAAKFTETGGKITLHVGKSSGEGVVEVADSGYGIPQERLSKLFEMFEQVPEHRQKGQIAGLGIGLSLARQLVYLHNGSIRAESEGLGCGSKFTVKIPLRTATAPEQAIAAQQRCSKRSRRRLLIVDDNVDAAESLRMLLKAQGHRVEAVHDGPDALRAIEKWTPEVVLLDIGMPEMDGFEVARRARAMPRGRDLRIIALTGWGQEADRQRARKAGFDEHLTKPVDIAVLESLLATDV